MEGPVAVECVQEVEIEGEDHKLIFLLQVGQNSSSSFTSRAKSATHGDDEPLEAKVAGLDLSSGNDDLYVCCSEQNDFRPDAAKSTIPYSMTEQKEEDPYLSMFREYHGIPPHVRFA